MRRRHCRNRLKDKGAPPGQTAVPPTPRLNELPQRNTGEMIPPPSVTEATTRHLGVHVERARGEE